MFYLEIPYFELLKRIETKTNNFTRKEADKLYYNYLNMKAFIYQIDDNKFCIIPENVIYDNITNKSLNSVNTKDILQINSQEYSVFFSSNSKFEEFVFDEEFKNPIIPSLKTVNSTWFSNFLDKTKNEDINVSIFVQCKFNINKLCTNTIILRANVQL